MRGGGCMAGGGMRGTGGMHGRGVSVQEAWQGACVAGGCVHGGGACMAGGMCGGVGGGAGCVGGQGVCVCGRGVCVAGETATASDGTHPTGMHSCFLSVLSPPSGKDGRHMISWLSIPGFPFLPPANEVSGR